tara:strand:- start:2543 stop:2890 length:348 start_codon:yes stop_codon:yes gene_type:complete
MKYHIIIALFYYLTIVNTFYILPKFNYNNKKLSKLHLNKYILDYTRFITNYKFDNSIKEYDINTTNVFHINNKKDFDRINNIVDNIKYPIKVIIVYNKIENSSNIINNITNILKY